MVSPRYESEAILRGPMSKRKDLVPFVAHMFGEVGRLGERSVFKLRKPGRNR